MSAVPDPTRVLIVDDDADQRFVLRRLFRREGITEVFEAADGDDALVVAREERPDVVVLDLAMPGRSGIDVLPELREAVGPVPIVVLSNLARRRWEAEVIERGAVGFVEKSTPTDRLISDVMAVAQLLERLGVGLERSVGRAGCRPALRPDLAHRDRPFDARRGRAPHLRARHQRRHPRWKRAAPGVGPPPRPDPGRGPRRRSDAPRPAGARCGEPGWPWPPAARAAGDVVGCRGRTEEARWCGSRYPGDRLES